MKNHTPFSCRTYNLIIFFVFQHIEVLLDENSEEGPSVLFLTVIFFCLNFLAATQDIAVDGWSLTLLSRENVGYASTCDTVGHLSGFFIGNAVFLGLTSADFSNRYLRTQPSPKGVVAFSGFFHFWGIVFLVTTTLVGLFQQEKSEQELHGEESVQGIADGYKTLIQILRFPGILRFVPILLTFKVRFENVLNNVRCSLRIGSRLRRT